MPGNVAGTPSAPGGIGHPWGHGAALRRPGDKGFSAYLACCWLTTITLAGRRQLSWPVEGLHRAGPGGGATVSLSTTDRRREASPALHTGRTWSPAVGVPVRPTGLRRRGWFRVDPPPTHSGRTSPRIRSRGPTFSTLTVENAKERTWLSASAWSNPHVRHHPTSTDCQAASVGRSQAGRGLSGDSQDPRASDEQSISGINGRRTAWRYPGVC